ncbi:hypothetical protein [Dyadobacter crusticola]|uniref:hypothetical protein n=1 Tax=Dyadobacter crusticola TaxID=292407 RepID=UPI0004E10E03|nr:hypothetical protein [Dyadobacter crusticola]
MEKTDKLPEIEKLDFNEIFEEVFKKVGGPEMEGENEVKQVFKEIFFFGCEYTLSLLNYYSGHAPSEILEQVEHLRAQIRAFNASYN